MKNPTTKHTKKEYEIIRKREIYTFGNLFFLFLVLFRETFVHFVVNKIRLELIIFSLLQRNLDENAIIKKLKQKEEEKTEFERIRCPHCKWQPNASSLWFCSDCDFPEYFYNGCLTAWNTFNTKGKCPGCSHRWHWTSCLSCGEWALHESWYEKDSQK